MVREFPKKIDDRMRPSQIRDILLCLLVATVSCGGFCAIIVWISCELMNLSGT